MKKITTFVLGILTLTAMAQTRQKLTPELLFKMGRVNNPQLSPNGKQVLYEVKHYELSTNKGTNIAYIINLPAGSPIAVTDAKTNAFDVQWKPDGSKVTFLSSESGSVQLWEIDIDGKNKTQVSNVPAGINAYKYSP